MSCDGAFPTRARDIATLLRQAPYDEVEGLAERYAADTRAQVRAALRSAVRRHERETAERKRVMGMYALQEELADGGVALGVDEVGRGALAGPLTVAAVVLPVDPIVWGLNDSKQLSPARREVVAARVAEVALAVGMSFVAPDVIDRMGMASALRLAMAQAIADAGVEVDAVLIDGTPVHVHERERCVVRGDSQVAAIAAASVVAKVARDHLMEGLDAVHPGYHLADCKGYGSAAHIAAIRDLGPSPIHRLSFCGNIL